MPYRLPFFSHRSSFAGFAPFLGLLAALLLGLMLPASATVNAYILHKFDETTGGPIMNVTQGRDGNLYGITHEVVFAPATIFKYSPTTGTYQTLYTVPVVAGTNPAGDSGGVEGGPGMLQGLGTDTNFYGVFDFQIFKISTAGLFTPIKTYVYPYTGTGYQNIGLIRGNDGYLYGVASSYGSGSPQRGFGGVAYKVNPTTGDYQVLHNFCDPTTPAHNLAGAVVPDGQTPTGNLLLGQDGFFYGVTYQGGDPGWGTVYRMSSTGAVTILHNFTLGNDGGYPQASLVWGPDGTTLYGRTTVGGAGVPSSDTTGGVFFKMTTTGTYTILYTLNNPLQSEAGDTSSFILANDGNFYGTTSIGIFFRMTPAGVYTPLFQFQSDPANANESSPRTGGVIQGADGRFYGINQNGLDSTVYGDLWMIDIGLPPVTGTATAPVITSATTVTATVGQAFTYQITASNTPTSYSATTTLNAPGIGFTAATGAFSGTPTTVGTYTYTINATNTAGTGSATLTVKVVASVAKPVITSATTLSVTAGQPFTYQITATNTPTSFLASTTGAINGVTYDPNTGVISGTPTPAGTYSLTISATNAGGTGTATLTLTVLPASTIPVITSAATATATVGTAFSFQVAATNTPTSYTATGLPAGLKINATTGLISGTPTTAGAASVVLTAKNASGSGTQTLTLTVKGALPVITSATTATGTQSQAFSYQIAASNSPTSFDAVDMPAGLSVNATTGLISGTPTVGGLWPITISATNASGTGTALLNLTLATAKTAQTITFTAIAAKTTASAPFALKATSTSGLAVTFSVVSGPATVAGSTVTLTGAAGTVVIKASQAGNATYAAAPDVQRSFAVTAATKTAQTITFGAIAAKTTTSAPFALTATASSGLAVTYTVVSGPATVTGSTVTLTGTAGTVVIKASQAGNTTYAAATDVQQSFAVTAATKTAQTITFTAIAAKTTVSAPFALKATATSGLAVTFSVVSGPATVTGSTVTLTGAAGTVVLKASQAGNATYAAAPDVQRSFAVTAATKTAQTITFGAIAAKTTTSAPFALTATASSGLAVTYTVVSGPATVSGSTVTLTGAAGTVVIKASQAGDATYAAAADVQQSFAVTAATGGTTAQTITFTAIASQPVNASPVTLKATASSGLAVTFSIVSGPATISGTTLTLTGTLGTVVVKATQAGNATYAAATAQRSFTVTAAAVGTKSQTITFGALPDRVVSSAPFTLTATASSGLPVTFSVFQGPATISGNQVTLKGTTGVVIIEADQAGNGTYASAIPVFQVFSITAN